MTSVQLPCEKAVVQLLPTFRSLIARELTNTHGLKQVEVAEKLGITQPAVNQYLHMKRGKNANKYTDTINRIEYKAKIIAKEIMEKKISPQELMGVICDFCTARALLCR